MHQRYRALLILALLLLSGGALAQGLGFGMGFDDMRRLAAGPPAPIILLTATGGNLLTATGGNLLKP